MEYKKIGHKKRTSTVRIKLDSHYFFVFPAKMVPEEQFILVARVIGP